MIIGITYQRGDLRVRPPSPSQACEGFTFYKKATGKGPYTTLDHQTALKKLHTWRTSISGGPRMSSHDGRKSSAGRWRRGAVSTRRCYGRPPDLSYIRGDRRGRRSTS